MRHAQFRWCTPSALVLILGTFIAQPILARLSQNSNPRERSHDHKPNTKKEIQSQSVAQNFSTGHQRMIDTLEKVATEAAREHPYLGDRLVRRLRLELTDLEKKPVDKNTPSYWHDLNRWKVLLDLGVAEVRLGEEDIGVKHLQLAYSLLPKIRSYIQRGKVDQTIFEVGVGYMRLGETQNCTLQHSTESCMLPIQGNGIHSRTEGSTNAIKYFQEILHNSSPKTDHGYYFPALWLMNIAYMTLNQYPDHVPELYRIPESVLRSQVSFPRFSSVAIKLGVGSFNLAGGSIVDDFDGDGNLDLLTSTWDTSGSMHLFHNNGNGTFTDQTQEAGLEKLYGGLNLLQADYNNDGNLDVLVLRGAWGGKYGQHPNSLLQNQGDGTFQDVTFEAGLAHVSYPTQTAGWADYDNDGDLDLFIGNESLGDFQAPWQLFRNEGDGTFLDVATEAGVKGYAFTKGVSWGDYDGDRFPDLYISNYRDRNRLFRNRGDGTFHDVTSSMSVERPIESFPVWFWDYNNDGVLDLFVSSYAGHIGHQAAHRLGHPRKYENPCLYEGTGQNSFREVAVQRNLQVPMQPMGANFGDLNNDGYLDFYLGTGDPSLASVAPNLMFLNQTGKSFADVTMAGGFGHLQKGHGVSFADLDNDGDLDIFEQMGGAFPGDSFSDTLYENPGMGNNWLSIKLEGRESNRSAIGVRICVQILENEKIRSIYRHVNSGGSFGSNPLRQTIGVGKATSTHRVEIFWPTTGKTQTLKNVQKGQLIRVIEGQKGYTKVSLKSFQF